MSKLRLHRLAPIAAVALLASSGCGDPSAGCPFCREPQEVVLADAELMALRVRWSAVEQAASIVDPSTVCEETPSEALFRRNVRGNSCVLVPQCRIFLGQIAVPTNYAFFEDTDGGVGDPGDVVIGLSGGEYGLSQEMIDLGVLAHDHWAGQEGGILAIAVNRFVLANGNAIGVRGYGIPGTRTQRPLVYVVDPAFIPGGVDNEHIFVHEVGHALGLCHTDECDQLGGESSLLNLMNPNGAANSTRLVESQCLVARSTYPDLFESAAAAESQPGLTLSRRWAPAEPSGLLHYVQLESEASAEGPLMLTFKTRGPIEGREVSFRLGLDLDGDPATGADARIVAPDSSLPGTDLIVRFATDSEGNVVEAGLRRAAGGSFPEMDLPMESLQLDVHSVQAHVVSDGGCESHPAFNEITLQLQPALLGQLGQTKPSSHQALERVGMQVLY